MNINNDTEVTESLRGLSPRSASIKSVHIGLWWTQLAPT